MVSLVVLWFPLFSYGNPMDFLGLLYGIPMLFLCFSLVFLCFPTVFAWSSVLVCFSYGFPTGFRWFSRAFPLFSVAFTKVFLGFHMALAFQLFSFVFRWFSYCSVWFACGFLLQYFLLVFQRSSLLLPWFWYDCRIIFVWFSFDFPIACPPQVGFHLLIQPATTNNNGTRPCFADLRVVRERTDLSIV